MNPYNNVSEADFIQWQQERQKKDDMILALREQVNQLVDEVRYWQRQAMRDFRRD